MGSTMCPVASDAGSRGLSFRLRDNNVLNLKYSSACLFRVFGFGSHRFRVFVSGDGFRGVGFGKHSSLPGSGWQVSGCSVQGFGFQVSGSRECSGSGLT